MTFDSLAENRKASLFVLLIFFGLVFFSGAGLRGFWAPDEPTYAETSREMIVEGNWLLPHINNRVYPDKPPLYFWAISAFSLPVGYISPFTARIPGILAAIICILLCYEMGRQMFNPRVGLLSALILGTAVKFMWQATWVQIDMFLCALFFGAMWAFWMVIEKRGSERLWKIMFFFFVSFAMLAKGFPGILPVLIVVVFYVLTKNWRELKQFRWLSGLAVILLIVGSWMAGADISAGDSYNVLETIQKHVLERGVSGMHHKQPFYYFFYTFPTQFLPWFVFFPGAAVYIFKKFRKNKSDRNLLFLMLWFGVIFSVFTLSTEKRDLYILPLYPAAALITGLFLNRLIDNVKGKWLIVGKSVITLLSALALAVVAVAAHKELHISPFYLFVLLPVLGAQLLFLSRKNLSKFVTATAIFYGMFFFVLSVCYIPAIDEQKSSEKFCAELTDKVDSSAEIATYPVLKPAFVFYSERYFTEITESSALEEYFDAGGTRFCIMQREQYEKFSDRNSWKLTTLIDRKIGSKRVVLVKKSEQ